ncbi:M81 family metallopeptidase [Rhizobium metallidurans]|uniref:Microcystin degradation protein MlrC n=1 Tax=Rhizobium metallidurans TaxID=1265931 RepID=A0A7W6CW97_9HYPH|nr:M81 family metallopeptidase [Rhizobium metallidurans]MBB3966082.1 microcystin degradation protein MlrC [Rhizobium metallidurans]
MRIAIVGLSIEIMLASPIPTELSAVQRYYADEILNGDLWIIRGMLERLAEDAEIEIVPLCWAKALPGGPLTASAYEEIKADTLKRIDAAGPFDGVLVANHGALEVAEMDTDADTDFVKAIRDLLGPEVPISVSLDLHGDMTPGLLSAATVFSVLRTAPHRDDRETGRRAADQLIRVVRKGIKPKKAAVRLPILLPGEISVTTSSPGRELYGALPEFDERSDMMEANILVGFAWNDRPWTGATAFAVSETSAEAARSAALELAVRIWAERSEFRLKMETAEIGAGLEMAMRSELTPVFISDSGDNTTAGAAGDLTYVLQAALDDDRVKDIVVAGITAPRTVERLMAAGVGADVEIILGDEHLSRPRTERRVVAHVVACGSDLDLGGLKPEQSRDEPWVCVRIGEILATFHSYPVGITTPQHFQAMGISPTDHRAYVVKLGYLHPEFEDIVARHILLISDGVSQLDMSRLQWSRLSRPTYPLDQDFAWTPEQGLYGD